jgi:hypothetical protein
MAQDGKQAFREGEKTNWELAAEASPARRAEESTKKRIVTDSEERVKTSLSWKAEELRSRRAD